MERVLECARLDAGWRREAADMMGRVARALIGLFVLAVLAVLLYFGGA